MGADSSTTVDPGPAPVAVPMTLPLGSSTVMVPVKVELGVSTSESVCPAARASVNVLVLPANPTAPEVEGS